MTKTIYFSLALLAAASCGNTDKKSTPPAEAKPSALEYGSETHEGAKPNENSPEVSTDLVHNNATAQEGGKILAPGKEPDMVFETLERDFGTITEGQQVEMTYKFTNKGGSDLIISEVKAGCGCTIPEWPKDPIKPGQSGVIKAKFDSTGKGGKNTKKVFVYSNAKVPDITLTFTGQVNDK